MMSLSKGATVMLWVAAAVLLAGCGGQTGGAYGQNGFSDPSLGGNANALGAKPADGPAPNVALWPLVGDKRLFVQGVAGDIGRDLGRTLSAPDKAPAYKGDAADLKLKQVADAGFNTIRVDLFRDGQGLQFDKNNNVKGLDSTFVKNLSDLGDRAAKHKVRLYLVLLDPTSVGKGKSPISDPKARDAYLHNALIPLTRKLKGNAGVFAFDLYNEIESQVAGESGNGTDKGTTWDDARAFVTHSVKVVKESDPTRLVTADAKAKTLEHGFLTKLGLDYYDVRMFNDKGEIPTVAQLKLDRPLVLGAFGAASKEDAAQAAADSAFVENAVAGGYSGYVAPGYQKGGALLTEDGKPKQALTTIQKLLAQRP